VALRSRNEEEEMASLDELGGIPLPSKGTSGSCEREREGSKHHNSLHLFRVVTLDYSLEWIQ